VEEKRDTWDCLPASLELPENDVWTLRPGCPRTRGPAGPQDMGSGPKKVGSDRGTTGSPYLARPALAQKGSEWSRGRGVRGEGLRLPLPRSLARWLCAHHPLALPLSIAARPAPGPGPPPIPPPFLPTPGLPLPTQPPPPFGPLQGS
jgi:hypothetical protein